MLCLLCLHSASRSNAQAPWPLISPHWSYVVGQPLRLTLSIQIYLSVASPCPWLCAQGPQQPVAEGFHENPPFSNVESCNSQPHFESLKNGNLQTHLPSKSWLDVLLPWTMRWVSGALPCSVQAWCCVQVVCVMVPVLVWTLCRGGFGSGCPPRSLDFFDKTYLILYQIAFTASILVSLFYWCVQSVYWSVWLRKWITNALFHK
jgi:hypothetical protein